MTNSEILRFTVDKAGIAFGKGADFGVGGDGFIRVNTACPRSTLEKAMAQLKQAIDNIN